MAIFILNATRCRVKRHLISTSTHEHGQPAETKPNSTIRTQRVKVSYNLLDPKLDSKVLRS
jgi:hypothetical protein